MKLLDTFVAKVIAVSDYTEDDMFYLCNRVLALVGEEGSQQETKQTELIALKDELVDLAVQNGKVGELVTEKDCLGAELMNFITPVPSQVNREFWDTYAKSPQQAIADFYALSKRNDYIKVLQSQKILPLQHHHNMAIFKSQSIYQNLKKTPKLLHKLNWSKLPHIQNANFAWKMKVTKVGLTTLPVLTTALSV